MIIENLQEFEKLRQRNADLQKFQPRESKQRGGLAALQFYVVVRTRWTLAYYEKVTTLFKCIKLVIETARIPHMV